MLDFPTEHVTRLSGERQVGEPWSRVTQVDRAWDVTRARMARDVKMGVVHNFLANKDWERFSQKL